MLHAIQLHRHQNDITKVLYLTMERGRMVRMRRRSLEFHVQHLPSTTDRQQLSWHFISPVPLSLPVCMYNCTHPLSLHVIADVRQCHRLDPALVKKIVKRDPDGGGCRGAPCGQPTGTSRLSPNNKPASSSSSSLDARTFCSWQAWIPPTAPPKSCIQADFSV